MLRIVFTHASCGASRSVSREIVGYRPLVLKCGYVFDLNGLILRPLLSKCCGIGGLTHYLTYCGNSYFRGDGCFCGFFVLRIMFAHAGCGASGSVSREIVSGSAPSVILGSNFFRIRMIAANFTSISSYTCFCTCRFSGYFRNIGCVITLNYSVSVIFRNSDILICKIITYIGREITADNNRCTDIFSEYVAGRILG